MFILSYFFACQLRAPLVAAFLQLQHSRTLLTPALSEMAGMMGAMGGMGDGMKEAAKKAVEDEIAAKAPGSIKPFFPCLGGPVPTVETCILGKQPGLVLRSRSLPNQLEGRRRGQGLHLRCRLRWVSDGHCSKPLLPERLHCSAVSH